MYPDRQASIALSTENRSATGNRFDNPYIERVCLGPPRADRYCNILRRAIRQFVEIKAASDLAAPWKKGKANRFRQCGLPRPERKVLPYIEPEPTKRSERTKMQ